MVSRAYINEDVDKELEEELQCHLYLVVNNLPYCDEKCEPIRISTKTDSSMPLASKLINEGWPDHRRTAAVLSKYDGLILNGSQMRFFTSRMLKQRKHAILRKKSCFGRGCTLKFKTTFQNVRYAMNITVRIRRNLWFYQQFQNHHGTCYELIYSPGIGIIMFWLLTICQCFQSWEKHSVLTICTSFLCLRRTNFIMVLFTRLDFETTLLFKTIHLIRSLLYFVSESPNFTRIQTHHLLIGHVTLIKYKYRQLYDKGKEI